METATTGSEKACGGEYDQSCIQLLLDEYSKLSDKSKPFVWFRASNYPAFVWDLVQRRLNRLEEMECCKVTDYIRPGTGELVPGVKQVQILPAGIALLPAKITEHTETTIITDKVTEIPPEEQPELTGRAERERRRSFMRTERGFTIMNETDLADLVNYHVRRRTEPGSSVKDQKNARVWLDYVIRWRRADLQKSPALLEKAQYYRDLPIKPRKRG